MNTIYGLRMPSVAMLLLEVQKWRTLRTTKQKKSENSGNRTTNLEPVQHCSFSNQTKGGSGPRLLVTYLSFFDTLTKPNFNISFFSRKIYVRCILAYWFTDSFLWGNTFAFQCTVNTWCGDGVAPIEGSFC